MERNEMLKKLREVKAITTNMVATYDMGMQFDVMTSTGVCTNFGNVGNWPCYKLPITSEVIALKERVVKGDDITSSEVLDVEVFKDLLSYTNSFQGSSWVVEGKTLETCIANLLSELKALDTNREAFYAYADLEEWSEHDIKIFTEYEDLCKYFGEVFGTDDELYEDMDDEELKYAYETAEEEGWNSVAFKNFMPEDDSDENCD